MTDKTPPVGSIISADVTVPNAVQIRDFYKEVVGWESEEIKMSDEDGEYADYVMKNANGGWVGGVCHRRGQNSNLPAQWIVYVKVADIAQSIKSCLQLGGKVVKEAKNEDGSYQFVLVQDPAGMILGLTSFG